MKPNTVARAIQEQVETNRIGLDYQATYAGHRERLTQEILARAPVTAPGVPRGRLCLLGAGNAFDVDLAQLAEHFSEIHLVDVDAAALQRARDRLPAGAREQLFLHAPLDISGSWDRLAQWAHHPTPSRALPSEVAPAVARVLAALPGPFDLVVSCCVLTQLQLVLVEELGDSHPAFESLRNLINAVHVRVVAGLIGPAGRGLLVTDLTSDATYPLDTLHPEADLGGLMSDLVAVGNVIHCAHPGRLSAEIRRDPGLSAAFEVRFPVGPWLWHNGPDRVFLVYALEISPKAAGATARATNSATNRATNKATTTATSLAPGRVVVGASAPPISPSPPGGSNVSIIEMDNVIPKLYEDMIEAEATSLGWYFHPESARPGMDFKENYGGFYHMAYDGQSPNPVGSAINAILVPLLFIFCDKAKLQFNNLVRVRLGMFARSPVDVPFHNPHVDFYAPHKVALYYVNDSDGDTVVFKETSDMVSLEQSAVHANENKFTEIKRIPPRKGRMVAFDGNHYHASMHPMKHQSRIVVTFNFT